jgi:hypothetical protein
LINPCFEPLHEFGGSGTNSEIETERQQAPEAQGEVSERNPPWQCHEAELSPALGSQLSDLQQPA